ncbi:DNA polymerase-3 subunit delta' [Desulfohalotomaculum tongense]|uniref:DNA polymerase III subunit delta' n=1 Tax=Desulforadius tongensis TaxID=1216062 RepID=UPI00195749D0|nr:DNA polymerase III subunit delta' [Desulforadius tongensis]MBM7855170.1 DNA polymerase-3 subunit delta' [Desulforadius tongensis]
MQQLKDIIGHSQNIRTLLKAVKDSKVAHAYLFIGPEGVGKTTTGAAFARALLCENPADGDSCGTCRHCRQVDGGNHPDLHQITPAGAVIKLEQIHQLQKNVYYRSYQGGRQVYIIKKCDVMTAEAANSLLKTLEEPPGNAVFILISSRPYALLPTILSRCQQFWFKPMSVNQIVEGLTFLAGVSGKQGQMIASMAGGSLGRALALHRGDIQSRRKRVLKIFERIASGNIVELLRESADLSADRGMAVQWIELIQLWLRDLLIWKLTGDKTLVINSDMVEELDKWAREYNSRRLVDMMEEIERARARLEARGNTRLVLDALFLSCRDQQDNFIRVNEKQVAWSKNTGL